MTFQGITGTIGSDANAVEITGDASGNSTLTITQGTGSTEIDMAVMSDQFSSVSLTYSGTTAITDISFPSLDVVDIKRAPPHPISTSSK